MGEYSGAGTDGHVTKPLEIASPLCAIDGVLNVANTVDGSVSGRTSREITADDSVRASKKSVYSAQLRQGLDD